MLISEFDYNLPERLIAQKSVEPRDVSRLIVVNRKTGTIEHKHFYNITEYLLPGDVLVLNKTKVFKARLFAKVHGLEKVVEVFLLKSIAGEWEVLLGGAKRVPVGSTLEFNSELRASIVNKDVKEGTARIKFQQSDNHVLEYCEAHGKIPVPPYVHQDPADLSKYQTIYAKDIGSVAAPTAGFHFTPELLDKIKKMGVEIEYITLHVGIGTFRPVKTEVVEEHVMHSEYVQIDQDVADKIQKAKQAGRRVIAVGTTTTRALEGVAMQGCGAYSGDINIFIKPGFEFKVIDGLITNFHLPKSTLLILVSALAGSELIKKAYLEAVELEYRFYSFGDAMLII
ncbi:tRNA preQ1(34) S-adenosylmethionine ribosyltransferase-isomerase QueA [Patescibacteria group bacterium]|nr:tRNA preQ1(34) S-adenosylmethionine ribosyltransferase-isomerase QueA [Patescibacteria group bacterium]MBU4452908.1 tRNA preQ1(34) S-adenosylmethionine ribosyltransferase-isomerase QueA [Patescibacteria group bacterium]MCG2687222.1 tRNA preQ1(34) S-adenosylmethionine ribosyltransferase-isomerase QueA [Candidatus Parcubacteria bacterium]